MKKVTRIVWIWLLSGLAFIMGCIAFVRCNSTEPPRHSVPNEKGSQIDSLEVKRKKTDSLREVKQRYIDSIHEIMDKQPVPIYSAPHVDKKRP